ncbi:MAG: hypothetical protein UW35_C0002G0024 [Candidatus Collierbacteria bacterium GW2011_GWF2_44_15]|uniref:Fimbrial assembly family protein n=5 Tax=Candidatus Collieribacteriota TaxID=1752725 RepID=A0A0G1HJT7_9BACT|nr:MAG: hypothetical protein UW23_C0002G0008 [Candidatus Collierbacteria bacterium GW2011_GWA1_44_12]KKT37930.1 MAG: hypothetical protein UW26_C0023G0006 [Candidatus Collierbacteria bacterium GW2011_GWF1_44_12]KKT47195.1 MAG: hypothetical protein UW35_C0002G0024 [Candidatus Collierbacteria bacterium GW2011_GWF2_44_15]KKT99433.1 MAG: hypothetical protein UW99_C0006G0006 [Candidatus Collierbacteria bacterium GW2011_GWC2_45_15]KKU28637.1 MAG: hypothetical protein UX41_C0030G0008 [Candidatus Collie
MIWPVVYLHKHMVQVNLLSKKKGIRKQRNIFSIVGIGVFGLFSIFFLVQIVMLVIRYISVNQKLTAIKEETETISTQMLKDNERLNQFILTKFILGEILTLRSKQFDYSAYLEQAQAYIPAGSEISGVDFQTVGFVNIRVMSRSSNQVALLEKSLKDADLSASSFDRVVIKSVIKSDAVYRTDLLFGIKKNGDK